MLLLAFPCPLLHSVVPRVLLLFQWLFHWSVLSCHAASCGHRLPRPSIASCCSSRRCQPGSHDFALRVSFVGLNPSINVMDGTKITVSTSQEVDVLRPRVDGTRECVDVAPCSGNDNDHSFSQLPVHKALTCPQGWSAWAAAPSSWRRKIRSMQKNLTRCSLLLLFQTRALMCDVYGSDTG